MYFDVVIGQCSIPVFNGTSEEVLHWLKENEPLCDCFKIIEGVTLLSLTVSEYKKLKN
jgi:hypothetical protein